MSLSRNRSPPSDQVRGWYFGGHALKRGGVGFAGADADRMIEPEYENLTVADLSGFRRRRNRVDDLVYLAGGTGDLDLDLGQKAHRILGAAIDLGVALLPTVALHFRHRQALHADFSERIADIVKLEGFNDGHHHFHR